MPNSSNEPESHQFSQPHYRVPHEQGWGMEFSAQELNYDATGIAISNQERCPRCGSYTLFPHSVVLGAWASRANVLTCGSCGLDYRVIRGRPYGRLTTADWARTIVIMVVICLLVLLCMA